ncbi:MAG: hypothetical protein CMQ20_01455 [Gammaproteobacteria bacterium]|nr:hypothetical protein [Gammaproteobacteria bacterium]
MIFYRGQATRKSSFFAGIWSGVSSVTIEIAPELANSVGVPVGWMFSLYSLIVFVLPIVFFVLGFNKMGITEKLTKLDELVRQLRDPLQRLAIYLAALGIGFCSVFFTTIVVS